MPNDVVGSVLVVGGGIAGMQSALDLANSGYYVYLLEKTPSIGGVMSQLDKTFPTNDCAMCILAPKMIECANHERIELLTYAELESLTGVAGNFKAGIYNGPVVQVVNPVGVGQQLKQRAGTLRYFLRNCRLCNVENVGHC